MMRTIRFWWWFTIRLLSKHRRIIVIATGLTIALVLLSPSALSELKRRTRVVKIGIVGRYTPTTLPFSVTSKLSSGLTTIGSNGEPQSSLASSWTVSDDGTIYTFTLDGSKTWVDGSLVRAHDIRLAIETVNMEILDDRTIRFRLQQPFAPFPTALAQPIFKEGLIGVGPYRVQRVKRNGEYVERIELALRNESPIQIRFYRTSREALSAFKLGEVDIVEDLVSTNDIPQWDSVVVTPTLHLDRYLAIFFNTKNGALSDKSIRQALAYAVPDKPSDDDRALSPINPLSWTYNPQVKPYETDVDQAKELLGGTEQGSSLTIELMTFTPYLNVAESIARSWTDALGIQTTVKVITAPADDFQALLIGQEIPPDPDQYLLWHSTQPTNISRYESFKVDKLLEDGRKTMDVEKRKEIYRDFQRFLLEDSPAAFISHITTYSVRRK